MQSIGVRRPTTAYATTAQQDPHAAAQSSAGRPVASSSWKTIFRLHNHYANWRCGQNKRLNCDKVHKALGCECEIVNAGKGDKRKERSHENPCSSCRRSGDLSRVYWNRFGSKVC